MRRRAPPFPRTHPIAWVARGKGYSSEDGRFLIGRPRGTWVLTDTKGPDVLREQAARSLTGAQRRAERIMEGEDMQKDEH